MKDPKSNDDLKLIKGFAEWFVLAAEVLRPLYTAEVAQVYEEFEDFAVEVFFVQKYPELLEDSEDLLPESVQGA